MHIDARTTLLGLLGNPVAHSISPLIHNTISERLGINEVYLTFAVQSKDLKCIVDGAFALGVGGLNVTVPYKQEILDTLVDIDPVAKAIGAVNTLVRVPNGFKGYNTDYIGLKRQMDNDGIVISGSEIIIIGAGGAARAVTYMCATNGAKRIYLCNRTLENAKKLAEEVNLFCNATKEQLVVPMKLEDYTGLSKKKYTVIQTTSKGLFPDTEGTPIEDEEFYELIGDAVDIICNPYETKFMKLAKAHGARTFNGLGMLLYQGVAAYELWNNLKVNQEICDEVFELMKKEMGHQGE